MTENANIRINVDRVKVEGCLCFSLHSSRDGRVRSHFLGGEGEWIIRMRVRSVRKVECYLYE